MNLKYFLLVLLTIIFSAFSGMKLLVAQKQDSTTIKPTQFRRGIELQPGYQSYEEKYYGKNLNEEKRKLFPLQSTGLWTELNPKVPRVDYLGVQFLDRDTGWAVGDLGALIKTTDGGNSWTVSETNTTTPILKVRSYNGQIVIASGFNGLILRSTDGGESYSQVTSNVPGDLWGLQMINDTLGWACGNANSLTKTTDGGLTWQRIFTPGYTTNYWWIDFLSERYGFIAGDGKVLRTTDGGGNWEILQAGDSYPLFSLNVIDSLHLSAAGYGGTGYPAKNIYSSDGGNTWINGGFLTMESVNCIKYVNPDTGYLVMTNVSARKTTNRGQEWTTIQGISDNYELQFFEENDIGYSAGTELKLAKAEGNLDVWNRLIINDNFSDVFFVNEQKGFVISSSGLSAPSGLYKTTDAGLNWQKHPSGLNGVDLLFLDSLTGFIAGPTIYKTTNSGEIWYPTNLNVTTGPVVKIFFINSTTGWAITIYSSVQEVYILKTTDGGENWFEQFNNLFFPSFTSIYFVDSLYGWVSCINGRPFKTTDSGENWVEQTNLNISQSRDVYFSDLLRGWIISGNELYYTTDSGSNWVLDPQIYTYSWHFETITDSHFIITGSNIYESIDAGQVWQNLTSQTGSGFTSLHAPKNYLAYGVGTLGYIISYLDTSIVPVELINFSADYSDNKIHLHWVTTTETNNYGFEVLRSSDNQNWNLLEFINGNGTTTLTHHYQFTDRVETSGNYYYKLKQLDYNGNFNYSNTLEVNIISPSGFELSQNFPNPFNSSTTIRYQLPKDNFISLKVYDVLGNEIKTLIEGNKKAGYYSIAFSTTDLSSGIYFFQLRTEDFVSTKKMVLLK
ncbi:MAG TPA: YCF48-related protein [Ignavibacteriaceae bacterium]|nr:YCF48-related protein [Ignavibacteriaceae bacterium]